MNARIYRITVAAYLAALLALFAGGLGRSSSVRLVIIHTNDIHGWILPHDEEGKPAVGGMAALAAFLARQPKPYLLLDGGDLFQGTPEGDLTRGDAVVDVMDAVGYDAAAVGNHEFDEGIENLARLTERADFPFLAANLADQRQPARLPKIRPWIIKEVGGVRVGVFGLSSSRTPQMVFGKNSAGLEFGDEKAAAEAAVAELRASGADVIVALTHIGWERKDGEFFGDAALARSVRGIDLIVGGHSHTPLQKGADFGGTLVVQAGGQLRWAGRVVLEYDPRARKVVSSRSRLVPLEADRWGEDAAMKSLVKYYREAASAAFGEDLDAVVGAASVPLTRSYREESPSGNWHADVFRRVTGADIAVHNSGGIRADLKAGPLTVRDLYFVAPFAANTLVTLKMTGEQVRALLEHGVAGPHGLLQVSGVRLEYDPDSPAGRRLLDVRVGDAPLERHKVYVVATNSFLAQGGDGYEAFRGGWEVRDTKRKVLDALIDDVKKNSPIAAAVEGRIRKR